MGTKTGPTSSGCPVSEKAWNHLLAEIEGGWQSAEEEGWVSFEEIEGEFGAADGGDEGSGPLICDTAK